MGVGGILYLFSLSPKLTAGILLGIPVIILPIVLLGRRLQNVSRTSQDRVADIGATTAEQMGAMKIVQAVGQAARERSEARRVGKEGVSTGRSGWAPDQ